MGRKTFPPTLREDDYPSIGQSRGGYTLVCHGDDRPTEWVGWLEEFASTFEEITNLAEEHGVMLTDPQGRHAPTSLVEFCQAIGIDMDSSPWQGQMISGTYVLGWLRTGTLRATRSRARSLLASMSKQMEVGVRAAVMRKLSAIPDFDTFLERTATDRRELRQEIDTLKESMQRLRTEAQQAALTVQQRLNEDTRDRPGLPGDRLRDPSEASDPTGRRTTAAMGRRGGLRHRQSWWSPHSDRLFSAEGHRRPRCCKSSVRPDPGDDGHRWLDQWPDLPQGCTIDQRLGERLEGSGEERPEVRG